MKKFIIANILIFVLLLIARIYITYSYFENEYTGTSETFISVKTGIKKVCNEGEYFQNTSCIQCSSGNYCTGGNYIYDDNNIQGLESCPVADSGWTANSELGSSSYEACFETQTPNNCSSGTVKRVVSSDSTYSTNISLGDTLKSNDGYYASINDISCSPAAAGYYAAAGATSQTACGGGKWSNATSKECSNIDAGCYGTSSDSACPATCASGSYSTIGSSVCTVCGVGKTSTAGAKASSSCTACTNATGVATWTTASWNSANNTVSNLCTINTCAAGYYLESNTCKPYYTITYLTDNLLYGQEDVSDFVAERMTYSYSGGTYTVTARYDDGNGGTHGRVYLAAGQTYVVSATSDAVFGDGVNLDAVEMFLISTSGSCPHIRIASSSTTITPTCTDTYLLRLDVNKSGATHTFRNISIKGRYTLSNKKYGETLGTLPSFANDGWWFGGWATSSTGTSYVSSSTKITGNATYYGRYFIYNYANRGTYLDLSVGYAVNRMFGGDIHEVVAAVWTSNNGQDDLIWYHGTKNPNGYWEFYIPKSGHNNESGTYNIHIYDYYDSRNPTHYMVYGFSMTW